MDKLYNRFERFCSRHSGQGIPNLMIFISAGMALVYLFSQIDPSYVIYRFLCFDRGLILKGQVWRLITYIFIPQYSNILWLVIGLFFYISIGRILERDWGVFRFNLYYISGVLITAVAALLLNTTAYSTYINLSVVLAYATLYAENTVLIMFIIPLKMKWLAWIYLAFTVASVILGTFPSNLLPLFALLNYALFFYADIKSLITGTKKKYSKESVHFRSEMNKIKREQSSWVTNAKVYGGDKNGKPYNHKCHICGKTDAEYPDMDFRYCSRCNGYYCYCPEHIHDHVHVE